MENENEDVNVNETVNDNLIDNVNSSRHDYWLAVQLEKEIKNMK
jgi:hypothetical protein